MVSKSGRLRHPLAELDHSKCNTREQSQGACLSLDGCGGQKENRVVDPSPIVWFDPSNSDQMCRVKEVLSSAPPETHNEPTCRESQCKKLLTSIKAHLQSQTGASICIGGPPGTGKSMTVLQTLRTVTQADSTVAAISVNCMSVQRAEEVFGRITQGLEEAMEGNPRCRPPIICPGAKPLEDVTLDQLVKGFQRMRFKCLKAKGKKKSPPRMVIVILDEMDCLLCRHEDVLSQLFMLPKVIPKSNLILIGISNSIDLTVRALATLERQKFVPELINFPGYTYGQLLDLLQERLQRLPGPVFNPLGLRLCAKKVAAASGDMRCALEACALAMSEHIASWQKSQQLSLISVEKMSLALAKILGGTGSSSSMVGRLQGLPAHQQLLICCAAQRLSLTQARLSERPRTCYWGDLQRAYMRSCNLVGLRPLNGLELRSAAATLADMGLLKIGKGRDEQRQVTLGPTTQEISLALKDRRMFSKILPA